MSDGTEDEEYEGFVKMLPNPILPTQKMIDMHMVTHTPYANWCTHCVRGRGAMYAHRVIKNETTKFLSYVGTIAFVKITLQFWS